MDRLREEVSKSECVRGVSSNHRSVTSRSGRERWADTEEAEVDPGCHEAEVCQEHGGLRAQNYARYCVGEEEDGGEVLDTHAHKALGDGDGVLGDELLEGDEEAGLNGDAAGDGRAPVNVSSAYLIYMSERTAGQSC